MTKFGMFTTSYLRADEHVVVAVDHNFLQLDMRSAAGHDLFLEFIPDPIWVFE